MKFGKQLEDKITAAGAIGEKIPWLNYACVSPPSSRSSDLTMREATKRRRAFSPSPTATPPLPADVPARSRPRSKLKKLRKCRCGGDAPEKDDDGDDESECSSEGRAEETRRRAEASGDDSNADATTTPPRSTPASADDPPPKNEMDDADEMDDDDDDDDDDDSPDKDAAAPMHYCEICATAFFRELDRSMKATARAYFAWVSRILASAPLHQHKHTSSRSWLRRALSCSPSAEGGAGMMMSRSKREKAAAKKREKAVRLPPIRPRSRCERRSLRTFPDVTPHPRFPFNA